MHELALDGCAGQLLEAWTRLLLLWSWHKENGKAVNQVHATVSEATAHIVSTVLVTTMQDLEHGAHADASDEATEVLLNFSGVSCITHAVCAAYMV
jgi:hypothetical protein